MSTRAIAYLKKQGISFQVFHYPYEKKGAIAAALETGFPLERIVKTLVVDTGEKGHILALVPGHLTLDMKRVAAICLSKRAQLADLKTAERLTGYQVGGISPFGVMRALAILMDRSICHGEEILINGGRRGTMLRITPQVLLESTGARICDIGTASSL